MVCKTRYRRKPVLEKAATSSTAASIETAKSLVQGKANTDPAAQFSGRKAQWLLIG